jgi:transcription elongation factor Elf1
MKKRCPNCGQEFSKSKRLKEHLINVHHVGMINCRECGDWVKECGMRSHVKRKHGYEDYRSYLIKHGIIIPRMSESARMAWVAQGENRKTMPKVHIVQGGLPSLGKKK